jgi:hypothetical protein
MFLQGDLMVTNRVESANDIESTPPMAPDFDFSQKTYTLGEQIVFGVKTVAFFGGMILLFWLLHWKK